MVRDESCFAPRQAPPPHGVCLGRGGFGSGSSASEATQRRPTYMVSFWGEGSLGILGSGSPRSPGPLTSTLPGPREGSSSLNVDLVVVTAAVSGSPARRDFATTVAWRRGGGRGSSCVPHGLGGPAGPRSSWPPALEKNKIKAC